MTQPAAVETDPTTDPTDPVDPQAVTDPPPADPATDPADQGDDPRVKRANAQAAKYRTDLRAQEAKVAELETTLSRLAAVFNPEAGETDPAQQVATVTAEAESLRTRTRELESELLVHTLASDAGANAVKLLDSRSFTTALHGLDPADDDYRDKVAAAIKDAVSKDASLSTGAGQGPSRGGAPGAGQGPASPGAVTQEQFTGMGYEARAELFRNNPDLYRRLAGSGT